jgi:RNA polymerase sigma-70 factor, ECF subfamily
MEESQASVTATTTTTLEARAEFEDFFASRHELLHRRLCLLTGNVAEAEEIMQDAFLKLWERWDRVRSMEDPEGYLYRTAMNLFRKRYRRAAIAVRKVVPLQAASGDDYASIDRTTAVSEAMATLTPRQRAALVLTTMLGYSSEEAGHMLHIRSSTVRAMATQARAQLRQRMEDPR